MDLPYSSYFHHKNPELSKATGFKRVAIHWVSLSPGKTTSLPHAESLEEEFVFVLKGNPHAWIDGYVYELYPHCSVGFPAGTGIAHTFINNTKEDVELLVIGEKTKKENLCAFPLHPEKQRSSGIGWDNYPKRELGPHKGMAGPVLPHETKKEWPSCIVDCSKLERVSGFHYPGDTETFAEYVPIATYLGLKALGLGFELLPPGKRSSFPHAHKVEEEFAYVLSGTPDVWMNGFLHRTKPGDCVVFPPGKNIAHCLINNTEEPVWYFMVGEPRGLKDWIDYPMHPFRNAQCLHKGFYWEDRPKDLPFGSHNGRPDKNCKGHLAFQFPEETRDSLVVLYEGKKIGKVDLKLNSPNKNEAEIKIQLKDDSLSRRVFELCAHYLKMIYGIEKTHLP